MRILTISLVFILGSAVWGAEFSFPTPSDDQWQYPFNFTPGSRPTGSCFGAAGVTNFNDRDGVVILAWDTSSLITPGQGPDAYDIASIRVTVTQQANANVIPSWTPDLTVDEWFTFDVNGDGVVNADGIPRGAPGDTDGESDDVDPGRTIELFGAGFGPTYSLQSWSESSGYVGANDQVSTERDPFPFVYQDGTLTMLHVEDHVDGLFNAGAGVFQFTPVPWAVGVPQGYTPGAQQVPFDIEFVIDLSLSGGEVKRYFQNQLNEGRVVVMITSLTETVEQGPVAAIPSFYMKEGVPLDVGAKPAALTIELADASVPAVSTWGMVTLALTALTGGTIVLRRKEMLRVC